MNSDRTSNSLAANLMIEGVWENREIKLNESKETAVRLSHTPSNDERSVREKIERQQRDGLESKQFMNSEWDCSNWMESLELSTSICQRHKEISYLKVVAVKYSLEMWSDRCSTEYCEDIYQTNIFNERIINTVENHSFVTLRQKSNI